MIPLTKGKISPEHLDRISINLDAKEKCCEGEVKINSIQMREGIASVELILEANSAPEIYVIYHPRLINEDTANELGLTKSE